MANAALEHLIGNFTLTELSERSGKSIESIVGFALGTKSSNGATARPKKKGQAARAKPTTGAVETRTQAGREDLDQRVLEAIRKLGSAKADDLESVGGNITQRRAALHRLIASKKIRREGKARGTSYSLRA